jgi:hypothetical protein
MVKSERHPYYLLETDDINNCLRKRLGKRMGGVFSRDEVGKLTDAMQSSDNSCTVINLDPSHSDKGGTHWVSLVKKQGKFYYFDPLGMPPPKEIKGAFNPLLWSSEVYQNKDDDSCGLWCIKFCLHLLKGKKGGACGCCATCKGGSCGCCAKCGGAITMRDLARQMPVPPEVQQLMTGLPSSMTPQQMSAYRVHEALQPRRGIHIGKTRVTKRRGKVRIKLKGKRKRK